MKLIASIAAAMFVFASSASAAAPTGPVTMKAKNGDVTFNHSTHKGVDCTKCHATAAGGKIGALGKDKGHAQCQECHKAQAKGPQKCNECHIKKGA